MSALIASLEIFNETSMIELRRKSISLTKYLHDLLLHSNTPKHPMPFTVITPTHVGERGAQLSLRLRPGLLDGILHSLEDSGVVVDERKPDVIRVAPAPLYNTYLDVWNFVQVFWEACRKAAQTRDTIANGGERDAVGENQGTILDESALAGNQSRGIKAYGLNAK
jgi:kynureninase